MHNPLFCRGFMMSLALGAAACGGGSADLNSAEDADESVSVTSAESALTSSLSEEVSEPASASSESLATTASGRVPVRFSPAGCAVATRAGSQVTYVLTNCTGPYGLVKVSGTLVATYARVLSNSSAVQVTITGTGLKANQATLDVNATVLATQTGTVKKAEVKSTANGTGPRGVTLTRDGTYTVTFDSSSQCVTIDGAWQTSAGASTSTTTVSTYARCKGACPTSGSIVHTGTRGNAVTITYSGAATASWVGSGGRSGTLALTCSK